MSCLEEAIFLAARENALSNDEKRLSPGIRRAVEHLSLSYRQSHTLAQLARLANLSPSRFAHRFKDETGDAVIAYLLKLRLRDAAQQLELSSNSIKEICSSVGYSSAAHFSRHFRKLYGMSPRQYREKAKRREPAPLNPPVRAI